MCPSRPGGVRNKRHSKGLRGCGGKSLFAHPHPTPACAPPARAQPARAPPSRAQPSRAPPDRARPAGARRVLGTARPRAGERGARPWPRSRRRIDTGGQERARLGAAGSVRDGGAASRTFGDVFRRNNRDPGNGAHGDAHRRAGAVARGSGLSHDHRAGTRRVACLRPEGEGVQVPKAGDQPACARLLPGARALPLADRERARRQARRTADGEMPATCIPGAPAVPGRRRHIDLVPAGERLSTPRTLAARWLHARGTAPCS